MVFANPWVLLFLVIVPLMILAYVSKANQACLKLPLVERKENYSSALDWIGFHLPFIIRILTITLIIITLARPQLGQSFTLSKHKGLDIFFAVDASESMSALDLRLDGREADRLEVLKHILHDFILKREKDRLGLIVFGEKAFTQCPLTLDHGAVLDFVDNLKIGMVGGATAIGTAITLGVKRMKDLEAKSKILILMTDGQNTAGDISPQVAAELAKELNVKIYTIGIGQEGEVPFRIDTPQGPLMVKQEFSIDEDLLINIAEMTGGQYFRAKSSQELENIYSYIDKLEKTEIEVKEYSSYKDIFEKFLWVVLSLFVMELVLANTVLFRVS
jgi:Ca-activated chloride channel family protein